MELENRKSGPASTSIFKSGNSQAVRIPKSFRFPDDIKEVVILREGAGIKILPADSLWSSFFEDPRNQTGEDFTRDQPDLQEREGL